MTIKNRQQVIDALRAPNGACMSDRQIAQHFGIAHRTVASIRRSLISQQLIPSSTTKVVRRNGSFCEMNTARIGSNQFPKSKEEPLVRELYETGKSDPGYVYLLQGAQCIKIGKATQWQQRLDMLAVKLPFDIEPILLIECREMSSIERQLHHLFARRRIRGEWFELQPADIQEIRDLVQVSAGCRILEVME